MRRIVLLLCVVMLSACATPGSTRQSQPSGAIAALQAGPDTDKFARATAPRDFVFPQDHGPHNEFQTEWWYYTGNVSTADGRDFGYQFTLFRRALTPTLAGAAPAVSGSAFAFNQIYFAHFAVTDVAGNAHVEAERYSRGAAGLAGVQAQPFRAAIEDWVVETIDGGGAENVRIRANNGDYALDLTLENSKPIVFHGDRGLSQKSPAVGNASFYYSMTRMRSTGTVRTPAGDFAVTGNSWLDREWSTSVLDKDTVGWDWFAIQFEDQRELMIYGLRQRDGSWSASSKGTLVDAEGRSMTIAAGDYSFRPLDTWTSPESGAVYPVNWEVRIPSQSMVFTVRAKIPDQEMNLNQRYWEGAVSVDGTSAGQPIRGVGYLELTGYGEYPTDAAPALQQTR
jgi:predicted secreted hydrolase